MQTNTNNVNNTLTLLQTTGGKDQRTPQHGAQKVNTHNRISLIQSQREITSLYVMLYHTRYKDTINQDWVTQTSIKLKSQLNSYAFQVI
jgi:hypothetical protein